jgi:hypothetical protein
MSEVRGPLARGTRGNDPPLIRFSWFVSRVRVARPELDDPRQVLSMQHGCSFRR